MDLVVYYDEYWRNKSDLFDQTRLDIVASHVVPGRSVLAVDCGPGVLARQLADKGCRVVGTDMSHVAVARTQAKGIEAHQVDLDVAPLPFVDGQFDTVVSDSGLEHRYHFEPAFDECVRVLKPGGTFVLLLPNMAHWRCRWWLLTGHFPYVRNTPTDLTHLRFFTLPDVKRLLAARQVRVTKTDGSASLWVTGLYPFFFRWPGVREAYTWLARHWPALFARDFIIIGQKQ